MISTQRLLLIFFAINLVMGIVTQFYNNPTRTDLDTTIYTNEQSKINEQQTKTTTYQQEEKHIR